MLGFQETKEESSNEVIFKMPSHSLSFIKVFVCLILLGKEDGLRRSMDIVPEDCGLN